MEQPCAYLCKRRRPLLLRLGLYSGDRLQARRLGSFHRLSDPLRGSCRCFCLACLQPCFPPRRFLGHGGLTASPCGRVGFPACLSHSQRNRVTDGRVTRSSSSRGQYLTRRRPQTLRLRETRPRPRPKMPLRLREILMVRPLHLPAPLTTRREGLSADRVAVLPLHHREMVKWEVTPTSPC